MDWPGSTLLELAIVGRFAYAGFTGGYVGGSMLATNESGKWEKIIDDPGAFSPGEMVEAAPQIPLPVAEALQKQALLSKVYWSETAEEATARDKNMVAYYDYQEQGDEAAKQGDFDAAIAAWEKAAVLDMGDLVSCRLEAEQVKIRAAKDAKARMEQLHLTKSEAGEWYQQHEMKLWKQAPCDKP